MEKRGSGLLMLAPGVALVAVFLLLSSPFLSVAYRIPALHDLVLFFEPGFAVHPWQWLLAEGIRFGFGALGIVWLIVATTPRGGIRASLRATLDLRKHWRQFIWAFLLGDYGTGLLFSALQVFAPSYVYLVRRLTPLQQAWQWVGLLLPLAGAIVAARLLFAEKRAPFDKWLGYGVAAITLFQLGWSLLTVIGLGDLLALPAHSPSLGQRLLESGLTLTIGAAEVWAALALARRPDLITRAVRIDATSILMLAVATMAVSQGVGDITELRIMHDVIATVVIGYTAMSALFLVLSLGALAISVARSYGVPASAATPAAQSSAALRALSTRPKRQPVDWLRVLGQTVAGLLVSAALMGIAYGFFSHVDIMAMAFIFPLFLAALFVGPLLVFVFGILRGRIGYSLGAALLVLGLFGYRAYNLMLRAEEARSAVQQAETLNLYPFGEPKRSHDIVAIVDSYPAGGRDVVPECQERCRLVLLTSNYAYAIQDPKGPTWYVYGLVRDRAVCSAPEHLKDYLEFLASGFPGVCAVAAPQAPGADALIIRQNQSEDAPIKRQFPKGFGGTAWEFLERIDGRDELLGRIVWGGVPPPFLSDQKEQGTKPPVDEAGFYAAALKLPGPALPPLTAERATAVIAEFDALLQAPDVPYTVTDAWRRFPWIAQEPEAAQVLMAAIGDRLASTDPQRVQLGVSALGSFKGQSRDFARPAILHLLGSDDPALMKWGVSALFALDTPDIGFAKDALGAIVTGKGRDAYANEPANLLEILKKVRGAYPEPRRQAALDALRSRTDLTDTEVLALLSVAAHGGPDQRKETAVLILALPEPRFQQAVAVTAFKQDTVADDLLASLWTAADVAEIARRAPAVPSARLKDYVMAIAFAPGFDVVKSGLERLMQQRIATLDTGSPEDKKVSADLKFGLRLLEH